MSVDPFVRIADALERIADALEAGTLTRERSKEETNRGDG